MGKKKRTNNKQNTSSNTLKSIDEKVLAREIVKAHEEYEHYRQTEKEKEEKRQQEEWLNPSLFDRLKSLISCVL